MTHSPPKGPTSNTITLGLGVQHMNLRETDIQSIAPRDRQVLDLFWFSPLKHKIYPISQGKAAQDHPASQQQRQDCGPLGPSAFSAPCISGLL